MSQKLVEARSVGIIGKPHGIRGEVNVMLLTDYPGSILKGSVLYLDKNCTEEVSVEGVYFKKIRGRNSAVMKFQNIDSRNEAEMLRGRELFRSPGDSPVLGDDEFWIDDLEECRVYLKDRTEIGTVEKVEILPSNENLVICLKDAEPGRNKGSRKKIYVPLIDEYIDSIDISQKTVVIKKMPEYM